MPMLPVPSAIRFQPVAADELAARLVELALGEPAGLMPGLAGPKVYPMVDLLRGYLRARGKHRPMPPVRLSPLSAECAAGLRAKRHSA
jgi:uncharacterized protein YbjT (DUF2867 family)